MDEQLAMVLIMGKYKAEIAKHRHELEPLDAPNAIIICYERHFSR
jgi:hypothetical protein